MMIDNPTVDLARADDRRCPAPTSRPPASSTAARASARPTRPAAASFRSARKAGIETQKKSEKQQIVVTEIPYMTNKARLHREDRRAGHEKRIEGISDLRDESDREGIRIVIELKRDAIAEIVLNHLYRNTQMQTTFGIIILAIVNNKPEIMPLPTILRHFIEHRKEIVVRRTRFELRKAEERAQSSKAWSRRSTCSTS